LFDPFSSTIINPLFNDRRNESNSEKWVERTEHACNTVAPVDADRADVGVSSPGFDR